MLLKRLMALWKPIECDERCPACGARDAVKINPLEGALEAWPGARRPMLCAECWALLSVGEGRARLADAEEIALFRRLYPPRWRTLANLQWRWRRDQLRLIRSPNH